jgi:hypothetical protein
VPATPREEPAFGEKSPSPIESACAEQAPQTFLMRRSYMGAADPVERVRLHGEAIEYRTRRYGFVEGFGDPSWNARAPRDYARDGSFFGIGVRMNERVLSALRCVEEAIARACAETPYQPEVLDGLRGRNTFYNGEVSNHIYGIAIDIDPGRNACCGCVEKISDRPLCKRPVATPFERSSIPKCWVDTFERFGFYWLGYDTLEDTMHFEFLGDPDEISS